MRRLACVLLLLAACDDRPVLPSGTPTPEPPLPPLPAALQVSQLDWTEREKALPLDAGGEATLLWDLSPKRYRAYSYLQRTQLTSLAEARGQSFRMAAQSKHDGYLEIEGGGNGRGELRYKRTLKQQAVDGAEVPADKVNEDKPSMFQCLLAADGAFLESRKLQGQAESHYLDLLLALPPGPLAPGATCVREFHFGTNVTDFGHHGRSTIRHAGRGQVLGRECVKLVSEVELEMTPPRTMEAAGRLRGRVVAWFDPALGCFVAVDAAMSLVVHTKGQVAPPVGQGGTFNSVGRTTTDTQVSIRLKD